MGVVNVAVCSSLCEKHVFLLFHKNLPHCFLQDLKQGKCMLLKELSTDTTKQMPSTCEREHMSREKQENDGNTVLFNTFSKLDQKSGH